MNQTAMLWLRRCVSTNQGLTRRTINLLGEARYLILVCKIKVFFAWLKEESPCESISEIQSERMMSLFRMLSMWNNLSCENFRDWRKQRIITSTPVPQVGFNKSWKMCLIYGNRDNVNLTLVLWVTLFF